MSKRQGSVDGTAGGRCARRSVLAAAAGLAAVGVRIPAVAAPPNGTHDTVVLEAAARRAGLRTFVGTRLVLATDRPPREGDDVDGLPALFAEAVESWRAHFHLDDRETNGWRAFACLMSDRETFRAAGLLPTDGSIPDFAHGFCDRNRFWIDDQSNPAYRRHLLLHEGVHAFTITLRGLATPTWYTEGIAEFLATHRIERGRFVPTPIPRRAADVEQLGRIETLRRLRAAGGVPGLADVLATPPSPRHEIGAYAASWAAVALLALHPDHAERFAALEAGPLDARLDGRLASLPGWDADRAGRDYDAFTDEVDYGFDFARSRIDWSPGRRLDGRTSAPVAADRGWQPTGVALARGERVEFAGRGRVAVGRAGDVALESTADGISLRWYRGRPLGRLLLGQWAGPPEGGRPRFVVVAEGARGRFAAPVDGPLQAKINAPPGDLASFSGSLEIHVRPDRGDD